MPAELIGDVGMAGAKGAQGAQGASAEWFGSPNEYIIRILDVEQKLSVRRESRMSLGELSFVCSIEFRSRGVPDQDRGQDQ